MNPVYESNRSNVSAPIHIPEPQNSTNIDSMEYGRTPEDGVEKSSLTTDAMEQSNGQLSLPSDSRLKKRESSLPIPDDYPKIATRTTSQQRDDDDSSSGHSMPIPPKRYDSQALFDLSGDNGRGRVASPTPSGNSSVSSILAGVPPPSGSRSVPTPQQQAFTMFTDNLEYVSILVVGSNLSATDRGREQLTFLISIGQEVQSENDETMYPHKEEDELWRVEKQYVDFVNLDAKV